MKNYNQETTTSLKYLLLYFSFAITIGLFIYMANQDIYYIENSVQRNEIFFDSISTVETISPQINLKLGGVR